MITKDPNGGLFGELECIITITVNLLKSQNLYILEKAKILTVKEERSLVISMDLA